MSKNLKQTIFFFMLHTSTYRPILRHGAKSSEVPSFSCLTEYRLQSCLLVREARMGYYTGSIGSSSHVSITKQPLGQYAGSVGSRLNRLKRSSINISKNFGGQYLGSVGKSRVSLNCGTSAGGGKWRTILRPV